MKKMNRDLELMLRQQARYDQVAAERRDRKARDRRSFVLAMVLILGPTVGVAAGAWWWPWSRPTETPAPKPIISTPRVPGATPG